VSILSRWWLCCLVLLCAAPLSASPRELIIAIGDLHADLQGAQRTFKLAGVTNDKGAWVLRDATVVQTGDLTDRGPDGAPLLEWIRGLEQQAVKHNSRFIVLLGNHEVMNLHGDWRYVSRADVESFGGYATRQEALSLRHQGEWAQWLISKQAVLQLGGTVFVHGGVSRQFARPAAELSSELRQAILSDPRAPILGELGPLWYRGYWLQPELTACAEAREVLTKLGAQRMVMGHTTQADGQIHARCGGALFAIDTGISRVYGGRPAALKIQGDQVSALYESGPVLISANKIDESVGQ